nr:hypothetical protein [Microbulbifer variabilis]
MLSSIQVSVVLSPAAGKIALALVFAQRTAPLSLQAVQDIVFRCEIDVIVISKIGKLVATAFIQIFWLPAIGIFPCINQVAIDRDADYWCMARCRRIGLTTTERCVVVVAHMGINMPTTGIYRRQGMRS